MKREDHTMNDDFDPEIAGRFRALDRVAVPATWAPTEVEGVVLVRRPANGGFRGVVLAAAATVVAVALVGIAVMTRDRGDRVAAPSSSTTSTLAADGSISTVSTALSAGPPAIEWQMVRPEGSIAHSNVDAAVAGPAGFVATGVGLGDGMNWGRVWHSADGVSWTEPAVDVFGARWVGAPVATSTAYYLIAGPNSDRADTPADTSIFRSVDGENWQPVGLADGLQLLGAAGDLLVAAWTGATPALTTDASQPSPDLPLPPTELRVSVDGINWTAAVLVDSAPGFAFYGWIVTAGGRYYLIEGYDGLVVWESIDGLEWRKLPTPPQGLLTTLGDAVAIVTNPDREECRDAGLPTSPTTPDGQLDVAAMDEQVNASWRCGGQATIWRWDGANWVAVTEAGPGPTPVLPALLPFGGQLISPVITPDRRLSVSTSVDGVSWKSAGVEAFLPGEGGSPQSAIAATSADTAVFITPGGMGEFTNLLVGALVPEQPEQPEQPMTEMLAIGESVMLGAIAQLQGAGFVVEAKEGRGPQGVVDVLQGHLDNGTLPDTVVVHVGTSAPLVEADLDAMLELLVGRDVVVVTVYADLGYIDANNVLIRALPERYPNVKIADWAAAVESGQITGLFPDGIHIGTDEARVAYVQLVLAVLSEA